MDALRGVTLCCVCVCVHACVELHIVSVCMYAASYRWHGCGVPGFGWVGSSMGCVHVV